LDSTLRISDAIQKAKEYNMSALAMTDHGNMHGIIKFYETCKQNGIKPILGCETYISQGDMTEKGGRYHLTLLAKNSIGYKNLMYLVSQGYLKGFYKKPRVDKKLLKEYAEGIIALSGCTSGEIPKVFFEHGIDAAIKITQEYVDIFGTDNFYIEIQNTGFELQSKFNSIARQIADATGIKLVATNDVHYLGKEDGLAHQVFVCIPDGKTLKDEKRRWKNILDVYFRSPQEMIDVFPDFKDAIENTVEIANKCDVELELGKSKLPHFKIPNEGQSPEAYLMVLAEHGLKGLIDNHKVPDNEDYWSRLKYELKIIKKTGFAGYFLIVQDFVGWAKRNKIVVGPGRGSGSGSLVAYALGITEIDPLKYDLSFERFINISRISMPDFDIDFSKERRDEVVQYVAQKYGMDKVAQISTSHQMKSKIVIRDVGRVLGLPYKEVDKIAKLIPDPTQGRNVSIDDALDTEPKLAQLYSKDEAIKKLIDTAKKLEGLTRHVGTHAAGIVIADKPITEYTPLHKQVGKNEITTQYDMGDIEKVGLVKLDFLGLKTLTVTEKTLQLINNPALKTASDIPLDDPETFKLFSDGDTNGIFQMGSSGIQDLLRKVKPKSIEDVAIVNALFRPGPLQSGATKRYVNRRTEKTEIKYMHPSLESVLKPTCGEIIFQEQIMKASQVLAGFDAPMADSLRKCIGKKKVAEMKKMRGTFLEGCEKTGIINKTKAKKLFEEFSGFADYAFCKAHSIGYSIIAYQTAYLKTHYPIEFMTALMISDEGDEDKIASHVGECRARGIKVLTPDIHDSNRTFSVVGDKIRFGLGGVKGIGIAAVRTILESRKEKPFRDLFDFCERVELRACNRANVQQLIKAGAFDCMKEHRAKLIASIPKAIKKKKKKEKDDSQQEMLSLMDLEESEPINESSDVEPFSADDLMKQEREMLGCYITRHPLESYDLNGLITDTCSTISINKNTNTITLAGTIENLEQKQSKQSKVRYASFVLEDMTGRINVFVKPDLHKKIGDILDELVGIPIIISGVPDRDQKAIEEGELGKPTRIILKSVKLMPKEKLLSGPQRPKDAPRIDFKELHVLFNVNDIEMDYMGKLKAIMNKYKGTLPAYLHIKIPNHSDVTMLLGDGVNGDKRVIEELKGIFGEDCWETRD